MQGRILNVQPSSAFLSHDTEFFGSMDPYCVVSVGGARQQTRACTGGGKTPRWSEIFQFQLTMEGEIRFEVWDRDSVSKNDLVGEGSIPIARLSPGKNVLDVPLIYKGRNAGTVKAEITLSGGPGGMGGMPAGGMGMQPGMGGQMGGMGGQMGGMGMQQQQGMGMGGQMGGMGMAGGMGGGMGMQQPGMGGQMGGMGMGMQQQPGMGMQQKPGMGMQQPGMGGQMGMAGGMGGMGMQQPGMGGQMGGMGMGMQQQPGMGMQQPGMMGGQMGGMGGMNQMGMQQPGMGMGGQMGGMGMAGGMGGGMGMQQPGMGMGGQMGGMGGMGMGMGGGGMGMAGGMGGGLGSGLAMRGAGVPGRPIQASWRPQNQVDKHQIKHVASQVFDTFDVKDRGNMTFMEFYPAFCQVCSITRTPPPSFEELQYIFLIADDSGDMKINRDEFKKLCKHMFGFKTKKYGRHL